MRNAAELVEVCKYTVKEIPRQPRPTETLVPLRKRVMFERGLRPCALCLPSCLPGVSTIRQPLIRDWRHHAHVDPPLVAFLDFSPRPFSPLIGKNYAHKGKLYSLNKEGITNGTTYMPIILNS
jgi:hypothetical protein